MSIRNASHAGTWYTANARVLDQSLNKWLAAVTPEGIPSSAQVAHPETASSAEADAERLSLPITGVKALIGPHAGYAFSGPAAAWGYKCVDPSHIERVFVLGPSHHVYIRQCALSAAKEYATPIGNLTIDQKTIAELHNTGHFSKMSLSVDEDEHSLEMHLPYIKKVFTNPSLQIVPIMVGHIPTASHKVYGEILAPYLADPKTFFVISSDFCHWGLRFDYTYYRPNTSTEPTFLRPGESLPRDGLALWESIRDLDSQGMQAIAHGPRGPSSWPATGTKTAAEAVEQFSDYLAETENTICGAKPIALLLNALATLEKKGNQSEGRFVRYEQSSQAQVVRDSSVSYASGYVRFLQ